MKKIILFFAVTLITASGCDRNSSKSVLDSPTPANASTVKVAVTAEQLKASEEQIKADEHVAAVASMVAEGKISSDANNAFASLYGGLVWKDKILATYFQGKTTGYLAPVFEKSFTEGGVEKLLVIGHITPEPTETYFCHACTPLLGGAIFLKQGSGWVVESEQKIIGWGTGLSNDVVSIVQIGPAKYGVSIRFADGHQGYDDLKEMILVPNKISLDVALDVGFIEKPGPAACLEDNINFPDQSVEIKFESGNSPEYFDAVVHVEYNEGTCGKGSKWIKQNKTTRFQLHDGKYIPI